MLKSDLNIFVKDIDGFEYSELKKMGIKSIILKKDIFIPSPGFNVCPNVNVANKKSSEANILIFVFVILFPSNF